MVIVPHTSWAILFTTTVDPTSHSRACSSMDGGWDIWLLLRVLAISANPGRGVHSGVLGLSSGVSALGLDMAFPANLGGDFHPCIPGLPGGVFTYWLKIFGTPVFRLEPAWVFAVEGTLSFKHPIPLVGATPLLLVPQFLPLLHS